MTTDDLVVLVAGCFGVGLLMALALCLAAITRRRPA
jgi:predicted tellurium resistance membrane protein TerC